MEKLSTTGSRWDPKGGPLGGPDWGGGSTFCTDPSLGLSEETSVLTTRLGNIIALVLECRGNDKSSFAYCDKKMSWETRI